MKKSILKKMAAAVKPGQFLEAFFINRMNRLKTAFAFNAESNRIFRVYIVGEKWYFYSVNSRKFYVVS